MLYLSNTRMDFGLVNGRQPLQHHDLVLIFVIMLPFFELHSMNIPMVNTFQVLLSEAKIFLTLDLFTLKMC